MKSLLIIGLFALFTPLFVAPLMAEEKDTLNAYDVKFVKGTAQASLNERKLADLGSQKAQNPELKTLAMTLVRDHTTAETGLKALAKKKGVSVSGVIDAETADTYKKLEMKSGADFDDALVSQMDKSHVKCIKSFEEAQKDARDGDLREWISKTIVVIKAHHEKIKLLKTNATAASR